MLKNTINHFIYQSLLKKSKVITQQPKIFENPNVKHPDLNYPRF